MYRYIKELILVGCKELCTFAGNYKENMKKTLYTRIDKSVIPSMQKEVFEGKIHIIQDEYHTERAVNYLLTQPLLGIDTETRPAFRKGVVHKVSLLQVSSQDVCFLFRLNIMDIPSALVRLLENTTVPMIGLGLHDDLAALKERRHFFEGKFIDLQKVIQEIGIKDLSLQKIYANLFQKRISKKYQITNWDCEQLSEPQQQYAAVDAWACLKIYEEYTRLKANGDYRLVEIDENGEEHEVNLTPDIEKPQLYTPKSKDMYPTLYLKNKKEESLLRFHPWIFSGALQLPKEEEKLQDGETVRVCTAKGDYIATGHYQKGSISVRVLSFEDEEINLSFWIDRIKSAYEMRKVIGLVEPEKNNTFRLIHGEGDHLPGLVIDCYGNTAVIQAHSVGMHLNRQEIGEALLTVLGDTIQNIYYKSETTLTNRKEGTVTNGFLKGDAGSSSQVGMENGLRFHIDWLEGQKTGFFIDQRENRSLLEQYVQGKKVLNMFCYTGGFSVYAMRGGANLVHSVDSSQRAIDLTQNNINLNFPDDARHEAFCEDAFDFLNNNTNLYDVIVLDPPAFAKHRAALHNALKGYIRLNAKGLKAIKQGGILFSFSCSQVVTKEHFRNAILTAAVMSGRKVRILHQLHQPADHPINLYHPEGEYLKGLVLYVE